MIRQEKRRPPHRSPWRTRATARQQSLGSTSPAQPVCVHPGGEAAEARWNKRLRASSMGNTQLELGFPPDFGWVHHRPIQGADQQKGARIAMRVTVSVSMDA